jgi:hypothetical protein
VFRRITSSIVPRATRKAVQLLLGAVLLATVSLAAATPVPPAPCAYVTGGRMFFCDFYGNGDFGQQATVQLGSEASFCLQVRLSDGTVKNVPARDIIPSSGGAGPFDFNPGFPSAYMTRQADVNKQFPIYAVYHDPCKNVNWTFTVTLHVIP